MLLLMLLFLSLLFFQCYYILLLSLPRVDPLLRVLRRVSRTASRRGFPRVNPLLRFVSATTFTTTSGTLLRRSRCHRRQLRLAFVVFRNLDDERGGQNRRDERDDFVIAVRGGFVLHASSLEAFRFPRARSSELVRWFRLSWSRGFFLLRGCLRHVRKVRVVNAQKVALGLLRLRLFNGAPRRSSHSWLGRSSFWWWRRRR